MHSTIRYYGVSSWAISTMASHAADPAVFLNCSAVVIWDAIWVLQTYEEHKAQYVLPHDLPWCGWASTTTANDAQGQNQQRHSIL